MEAGILKVFITGWRVTSDFSLKVLEEDTRIAITCNAISQGHHGDTMIKKDEVMLTVLSKWMYIHFSWPLQQNTIICILSFLRVCCLSVWSFHSENSRWLWVNGTCLNLALTHNCRKWHFAKMCPPCCTKDKTLVSAEKNCIQST